MKNFMLTLLILFVSLSLFSQEVTIDDFLFEEGAIVAKHDISLSYSLKGSDFDIKSSSRSFATYPIAFGIKDNHIEALLPKASPEYTKSYNSDYGYAGDDFFASYNLKLNKTFDTVLMYATTKQLMQSDLWTNSIPLDAIALKIIKNKLPFYGSGKLFGVSKSFGIISRKATDFKKGSPLKWLTFEGETVHRSNTIVTAVQNKKLLVNQSTYGCSGFLTVYQIREGKIYYTSSAQSNTEVTGYKESHDMVETKYEFNLPSEKCIFFIFSTSYEIEKWDGELGMLDEALANKIKKQFVTDGGKLLGRLMVLDYRP